MSVKLTGEAEAERIKAQKMPTWELYRGVSIVKALRTARDLGWSTNQVQVRIERKSKDVIEYLVEPYEEGCSCRGLLKYKDYYGTEETHGDV